MLWAFELRVPGLYQIEVLVGVERAEAGRDIWSQHRFSPRQESSIFSLSMWFRPTSLAIAG